MKKESVLKKLKRYEKELELFDNPERFEELLKKEQQEIDGLYSTDDLAAAEHIDGQKPEAAPSPVIIESQSRDFLKDFALESDIALSLSGFGYRSMLFNAGVLLRLNEAGYLQRIDRISSVSSASIAAGVLGLKWSRLKFENSGVAGNLHDEVIEPLRELAAKTIDKKYIMRSILFPLGKNELVRQLKKHIFGDATLQDLPDEPPRIVINATNFQSGALIRFSKPYIQDWRIGELRRPYHSLAAAVAASTTMPPFFVELRTRDNEWTPGSGYDLKRSPFATKLQLTDGTLCDNFSLETTWDRYREILVSDGGGGQVEPMYGVRPSPLLIGRLMTIMSGAMRSVRRRQVINSFVSGLREGAYWSIDSNIQDYSIPDALPCPLERTRQLAAIPARLASLEPNIQKRLINWGYAVSDAAMRAYVDHEISVPSDFPYPRSGV